MIQISALFATVHGFFLAYVYINYLSGATFILESF